MSIKYVFQSILIARKGKSALFIAFGGLFVSILVSTFAFKVDNKLAQVESNMTSINRGLKELREISTSIADTSNYLAISRPVIGSRMESGKRRQVFPSDSALSMDSASGFLKDLAPLDRGLQDTVRSHDSIRVALPPSTVASSKDLNIGVVDLKQKKSFLTFEQAIHVLSENNQLKKDKRELSNRIKSMQAELASLKESKRNK